mmetsp:Transcript_44036/g.94361  ORF Transcript_44036/g.94361 Transcript_44036/m.94361 type:complete len:86 (+) Transcript_44036:552-809(+)
MRACMRAFKRQLKRAEASSSEELHVMLFVCLHGAPGAQRALDGDSWKREREGFLLSGLAGAQGACRGWVALLLFFFFVAGWHQPW